MHTVQDTVEKINDSGRRKIAPVREKKSNKERMRGRKQEVWKEEMRGGRKQKGERQKKVCGQRGCFVSASAHM